MDGDEHIIIFAKRDIKQWEELTYDYRFGCNQRFIYHFFLSPSESRNLNNFFLSLADFFQLMSNLLAIVASQDAEELSTMLILKREWQRYGFLDLS